MSISDDLSRYQINAPLISEEMRQYIAIDTHTQRVLRDMTERSAIYIEMMAAAFLEKTDIPPENCELVMTVNSGAFEQTITWQFRERTNHEIQPT